MNILQISTSDLANGAGIAAYRLNKALRNYSQNSQMLVSLKQSNDNYVYQVRPISQNLLNKFINKVQLKVEKIANYFGPQGVYSSNTQKVLKHPLVSQADIINIHNIHWHENNFSLNILPIISKKVPLVWTLHDMWPFTGHCIYSLDCTRWKIGCGYCPDLTSYMTLKMDTTALLYKIKKYIYKRSNLTIVTPSRWLQILASQSPLLKQFNIFHIPNGINQEIYKPIHKHYVRQVLDIDLNHPVVLFMASYLDDARKGYTYFEQAMLAIYDQFPNLQVLVVGLGKLPEILCFKFKVIFMGYVNNEKILALMYSAADIMIFPSYADNLPNTILECLACGTPVVAFDSGGIPEIIKHLETGYIARSKDSSDLADGIVKLLRNTSMRIDMQNKCVKSITNNFSSSLQAERYFSLYEKLINTTNTNK